MEIKDFLRFTPTNSATGTAKLDLFGEVGGSSFWGEGFNEVEIKEFLNELQPDQTLEVTINSPGGAFITGIAIYNILSEHPGPVNIKVIGLAASAASLITCARDAKVTMLTGSLLMIHPIRVSAYSLTKEELKQTAESLEKMHEMALDIYVGKTGQSRETIDELLSKETFLTGAEALELGFVDEIDNGKPVVTNMLQNGNYSINGLEVSSQFLAKAPLDFLNAAKDSRLTIGEEKMDLAELKAAYPELVAEICQEAVVQERERISSLNELRGLGHDDLVQNAIDQGQNREELAVAMVLADKAQMTKKAADLAEDAKAVEGLAATKVDDPVKGSEEGKQSTEVVNNVRSILKL